MAVLNAANRLATSQQFQSDICAIREAFASLTKADILAAVNALDDFLNTNAAAINTAIPQPARGALTTAQKARLLSLVIHRRYITGA